MPKKLSKNQLKKTKGGNINNNFTNSQKSNGATKSDGGAIKSKNNSINIIK